MPFPLISGDAGRKNRSMLDVSCSFFAGIQGLNEGGMKWVASDLGVRWRM